MCGIVGIIDRTGRPDQLQVLTDMAACLHHRGPDEEGVLLDGPVGFFHKRLAILDLVTGRQPMTSGHNSIVFNGEIYNYLELKDWLIKKGFQFETASDTEVILKMYEACGIDFVNELNGMFAFLLYDRKNRRVIAARDHFGIKPLYYYAAGDLILFASEIKAILAHPDLVAEPEYAAVHQYFILQHTLGETTLFRNIKKIMPGHIQVIDLDTLDIRSRRYWHLDFSVDTDHSETYFRRRLRSLVRDAVRIQMRSDVPLGTYLSGGMDSSIITSLAGEISGNRLKAFTGGFREGSAFDETGFAREAAAACGAELIEIFPTETDFISCLHKLVYHMDEPAAGPGLFPQYMVSRCAADHVKVILGGQGGDEIFGGYTRFVIAYFEQAIKGAIFETNDEGEHIVSLKSILPNLPYIRPYVPLLKRFWKEGLFDDMDQRYFQLIRRGTGHILDEDFIRSFDDDAVFEAFQKVFNRPDTPSYYNKMVNYDMVASLPALLQVEDRVSMAASIESRVPFLDRRIVELVVSMPPGLKFKGAELKYILKRSVGDILPQSILNRKDKMGFPVPLDIWAKQDANSFFRDILLSRTCLDRGLFNPGRIENLIENEASFGRELWGVINMELWFRQFID